MVIHEAWAAAVLRGMTKPDLIIFDCDGVLIDSQVIQARVDAAALTFHGYAITAEELGERFVGVATAQMQVEVERALGRALPVDFQTTRDRLVDVAYRRELRAIAGVEAAIEALGLPSCVASNAQTARLRDVLALTGLLPLFEPHVFGADLVARPKPAPDLFLFAAKRMGTEPCRCLVVEDSTTGVRAAVAAGMRVLGFHGGGHCRPGHDLALIEVGAAATFGDMNTLADLVRGLG